VCARSYRSVIDVKVDTQGCYLTEDVDDLRFVVVTVFFLTVALFIVGLAINNN
jgi:hypothetical protein